MITIAAPIAAAQVPTALEAIKRLGNPAELAIQQALDILDKDAGIHFASLHAISPAEPGGLQGHIVLEFTADGDEDAALARIADALRKELTGVFQFASDWRAGAQLGEYLRRHRLNIRQGWTGSVGLPFAGTPNMSVGRIRREAALAVFLTDRLGQQKGGLAALDRLKSLRNDVKQAPGHTWALEIADPTPPFTPREGFSLYWRLAVSFFAVYLWPLLVPVLGALVFALWCRMHTGADFGAALMAGVKCALMVGLASLVLVAIVLVAVYFRLRRQEDDDFTDERAPLRHVLREILEHENRFAHNHMVSITTLKPGLVRCFTRRLSFWIIGQLATYKFKPGQLGDIPTIHFARWVNLPGSRELAFFSNYGGSWESYLEDFITKAHNGLTAVWSNTVGFPRTRNLFQVGATDGERFKRFARRSMLPTPFWYSAYPELTTANIRTNAAIRTGFAAAMTEEEATAWLSLFGSATRPETKLESNQIQSLVFGGLGFMPYGKALVIKLNDDRSQVRKWLAWLRPRVAFDDGRHLKKHAVVTIAMAPAALSKAGLPQDALETFPPAYLEGMAGEGRARILGDDTNGASLWWQPQGENDVTLLVYGVDQQSVDGLEAEIKSAAALFGHTVHTIIPLTTVGKTRAERKEPFGFVDGVSQPVIRGTYRGLRNADPIHLVEAGEFILGYPDNRGNLPPGPAMAATDDPDNRLPIHCSRDGGFAKSVADAPREIGRNGSFLVIRQLEQDVEAFEGYCEAEAIRLRDRLGEPYDITANFIGAKLVGRWYDGSSLARNPYRSFSENHRQHATARATSKPADSTPIVAASTPVILHTQVKPDETKGKTGDTEGKTDDTKEKAQASERGPVEDNDFLLGAEDPEGLRCPFGAHIRRANPRDSLDPGSQEQLEITNRHRIIRVGRRYAEMDGRHPGLLFMCLNADIERQFEFVQQTWLNSQTFHGLSGERDPLTGDPGGCPSGFTIPTRDAPVRLASMSRFVTSRGGGYFFLPSRRLLEFLSD